MLKITDKTSKGDQEFGDLRFGDCFKIAGRDSVYMKINGHDDTNTLNLSNRGTVKLNDKQVVTVVKAELTITDL